MHAELSGHSTRPTYKEVQSQVESAIFSFQYMRSTYLSQLNDDHEEEYDPDNDTQSIFTAGYDLDYVLPDLAITKRSEVGKHYSNPNILEVGQNDMDTKFIAGVACAFDVDQSGALLFGQYLSQYLSMFFSSFSTQR